MVDQSQRGKGDGSHFIQDKPASNPLLVVRVAQ